MDWTTILGSLFAAITSCGGLSVFMYYRENKRQKQIDNEAAAAAQWRELYLEERATNDRKDDKIDGLYKTANDLRELLNEERRQNAVLKVWKCEKVGCPDRMPPFGAKERCRKCGTEESSKQ